MLDLNFFRQKLLDRRSELLMEQEKTEESRSTVTVDHGSVGRLSRIDAIQAQEMALAAQRQRELELQRIDAALRRMEEGEYGVCVRCGEDIAVKRLEIDPSVPTCINCASGKKA